MQLEKTFIEGLIVLIPQVFSDERGYFFESFNTETMAKLDLNTQFVQDNESFSKQNTLRGLHFQTREFAQSKLIRAVKGAILDVAVDLRFDSSTFGQHFAIELNESNKKQLFIPKNFAHGFVTLSEEAIIQYKCDNFYNKQAEDGINFADDKLAINWIIPKEFLLVNTRDQHFQTFVEFKKKYSQ